MKLHYIYARSFPGLEDVGINLTGEFDFRFDTDSATLTCERTTRSPLPIDFFRSNATAHDDTRTPTVAAVSALIGENGVGKTAIARLLSHVLGIEGASEEFILAFSRRAFPDAEREEYYVQCFVQVRRSAPDGCETPKGVLLVN